jgi:phage-related baseplate assembly protein
MADNVPRFGASDFFLAQTDPLVLREQLRASLAELLGRDVVDSDPHMVLASAFLPYLVQGLASADACAKATLRAYAMGQDLDRIADSTCIVGYLNRKPAVGAVLPCILQCDVTRSPATAAVDCVVSWSAERETQNYADETGNFTGSGELTFHFGLTDGATKHVAVPIYLRCETAGVKFNSCFTDRLAIIEDADLTASAVLSAGEAPSTTTGQQFTVDNVSIAIAGETYGGADAESDDAFAQRIGWQAKALRVPGSLEYFRLVLSELTLLASAYISPTVDSQGRIVMAWADKPNFLAEREQLELTSRGAAYEEFLQLVQGSLLAEQHVYAYPAKWYDPDAQIMVRYYLPANTVDLITATQNVKSAFGAWRTANAWHCGASIKFSDAIAALTNAGAVYVTAYGTFTPTEPLPADSMLLASQIVLLYAGLADASTAAIGGSGEDITPV